MTFNGLHLRLEGDVSNWAEDLPIVLALYMNQMGLAGFDSLDNVYVASGLLTYGGYDVLDSVVEMMKKKRLCKDVFYKEMFLSGEELNELLSE